MKIKKRHSLAEILESTKVTLFPASDASFSVELHSKDCMGDTPLHVLTQRQDLYSVEALIEAGADVNAVGDMGQTPLHIAVASGNEQIVNLLINSGAKTNIRSEFNETAIEKARKVGGTMLRLFKV